MSLPPLEHDAVALRVDASTWTDAITAAGNALVRAGLTRSGYTTRMVSVISEFGPYVVVAPGLALVHARPGPDVHKQGIAVVTLAESVSFGHPYNDPVSVVVAVASRTNDEHVTSVAELANVFNDPSVFTRLANATTVSEVRTLLGGVD